MGVSEGGSDPLGFSLQLTGTGAVYEDFTWQSPADDSFGAVNAGQDFIGGDATAWSASATPALSRATAASSSSSSPSTAPAASTRPRASTGFST
jgi:hypothetical protein